MKTMLYILAILCILFFTANLAIIFHAFGLQPKPITYVAAAMTLLGAIGCFASLKQ